MPAAVFLLAGFSVALFELGSVPKDDPITASDIAKWSGIAFTAISFLVTAIWSFATLSGQVTDLRGELGANKREAALRSDQQEKEITTLKTRADSNEKALGEMARKLDVVVALLERIDQKVGRP